MVMERKTYRWCAVPECRNTSKSTPNKVFVDVPRKADMRRKWLELAKRKHESISVTSSVYFCEDHFDMPNDMLNYMEYNIMGTVAKIRMRPGCTPSKFECQSMKCKPIPKHIPNKKPHPTPKKLEYMTKKCPINIIQPKMKQMISNRSEYQTSKYISVIRSKPNILKKQKKPQITRIANKLGEPSQTIVSNDISSSVNGASIDVEEENRTYKFVQMFPVETSLNEDSSNTTESQAVNLKHVIVHFLADECEIIPDIDVQTAPDNDNMTPLHDEVCRICLHTNCNMYLMTNYNKLGQAYEILTGLLIDSDGILPPYLCGECAHRLLNCIRFRTRGLEAHSFLLEVLKSHNNITPESITATNGNPNLFVSRLGITHKPVDQYDLEIKHVEQKTHRETKQNYHGNPIVYASNEMIIPNSHDDEKTISKAEETLYSICVEDISDNEVNTQNNDIVSEKDHCNVQTSNNTIVSLDKYIVSNEIEEEKKRMDNQKVDCNSDIINIKSVCFTNLHEDNIVVSEFKIEKDMTNQEYDCDAEGTKNAMCSTVEINDSVNNLNKANGNEDINSSNKVELDHLQDKIEMKTENDLLNRAHCDMERARTTTDVTYLNNVNKVRHLTAPEIKTEKHDFINEDRFSNEHVKKNHIKLADISRLLNRRKCV